MNSDGKLIPRAFIYCPENFCEKKLKLTRRENFAAQDSSFLYTHE